jgi:hypothetical protein
MVPSVSIKQHGGVLSSQQAATNITRPHSVPSFRPLRRFYFPSANFFFMNPTKREKS